MVRLAIERFQCIESAELELGPGLNVLYGPNDLGKSSLAWAIRAVLLLQHNSAQHERFVSWYGGGGDPRVALTFADDDGRYWRVSKTFSATSGRSTLEVSKDGRTFTPDASGRQVDERIRAMLRWGIPAPGGGGGSRGMPESFLTQVLLAEQASVREVLFGKSVANDPDEGGRQRLVEALGALAQDPLFKQILDEAQERVDEAFTPTGKRKRGAGSPFKDISERVKALHRERDELVGKLRDTEAAEARIRQLATERDEAIEELAEARRELAVAEQDFAVQRERAALAAKLAAHEQTIRKAAERDAQIAEAEGLVTKAEAQLAAFARQIEAARTTVTRAERDRDAARADADKLAQASDQSGVLEEAVRTANEALVAAVHDERRLADELQKLRALSAQIAELEAQRAALATESSRSGREQELWLAVALAAAGRLRAEEQALRAQVARASKLPAPAALAELRDLREQLRIAEARLEVGVAVTITPRRAVALKVRRDASKETTSKGADPKTVSAKRTIGLVVDDLVELEIAAGDDSAREELDALQARWDATGGKLLAAHAVESLEELEALRAKADEAARTADDRKRAAELVERAIGDAGSPDLDEDDEAEVASRLAKLKTDVATKIVDKLGDLARRAGDSSQALVLDTKIATLRTSLPTIETKKGPKADPLDPHKRAVADAEQRRLAARAAHDDALAKLAAWKRERDAAARSTRERIAKAEAEAKRGRDTADALAAQSAGAADLVGKLRIQLAEWKATQAATNLDAARAEAAALVPQLAALGPATELEEADVEHLRQSAARIERRLRDTEAELHKARGALEQVGGAIVRERQRELDQAIALAEEREQRIAIDYDAWKLLVDTLREAETSEGAHLGKALGGPVSRRFRELTAGRYGELALGANLEQPALEAAGSYRDPGALSAGTQDQLATLLRLCVAEQLRTSIVLDDHLAQSDANRVRWFSDALRAAAEQIQVVFLTCRPSELLAASELPTGADAVRNLAGGRVRAIDLSRVIQRYGRTA